MAKAIDRGLENREIVLGVLTEVLDKGNFVHLVLNQALSKYQYLEKPDRAFITRVTEGTLEYLLQIDYIINSYSKTKTEKMKPLIRNILRMSVYQLLYMDRVPDSAVCNEAVKLAIHHHFQGLKGFVNGVLRTIARNKEDLDLSSPYLRYSLPQWMYSMWEKDWGKENAEKIAESFLKERPVWVRCNFNLASKEEILASLKAQQATAKPVEGFEAMLALSDYDYLESLEAFQKGWIQVQDVSSMQVALTAAPKEGDICLDVCAAPGGKSLHLAELLHGTGLVEARDLTDYKVELIQDNIDRSELTNIRAVCHDATVLDESWIGKADIVLADLPCSGLGVLNKKNDLKYRMTPEQQQELVELQHRILDTVWQYVKPGGKLIYSTCTVHKAENVETVDWFLKTHPFLLKKEIIMLPGVDKYDGFFIAGMERKEHD